MGLMTFGAMLALRKASALPVLAQVGSDPSAPVKDLDGGGRRANFHHLLHQNVRYAVEVPVKGNVVIDVDGGARPLAHVETFARQRRQDGFFQVVKQTGPRSFALAERALVQPQKQFADRLVEFRQAEELPLPQSGHDPALDHLHPALYLGFVAWLVGPRRHHSHPIMHRKLLIGGIQIGIVAAGSRHRCLGIVGYRQLRYTTKKFQSVNMGLNPGFQLLIACRFRVGVRTGSQHRHKQRGGSRLTGGGVIDREGRSGPVHKHLFPGFVLLPQHHIQVPPPVLITLAKPTVAISIGMGLPIFLPHQLQRQMAMLLQLLVNGFPIRLRPLPHRFGCYGLVPEQLGL